MSVEAALESRVLAAALEPDTSDNALDKRRRAIIIAAFGNNSQSVGHDLQSTKQAYERLRTS